jgi:hypothetical protein
MSDNIDQLYLSYRAEEDRLLLRIITVHGVEVHLWLTRRFVQALWESLREFVESDRHVVSQREPQARAAVLAFQHEQALAESKFTKHKKSNEIDTRMARDTPLLAAELKVEERAADLRRLRFAERGGASVLIAVNLRLAHSLCKLLRDSVATADWGLELSLTDEAVALAAGHGPN